MKITNLIALIAALPSLTLAAEVDERIDAAANAPVTIRNMTGDIVVSGWDENAVHVTGEISDRAERLDVRRDGNRIVVEVVYPDDWEGDRNPGEDTDLVINVPRAASLDVGTISADVSVSGVAGEQRVVSVSGDIDADDVAAEGRFESVSGDIRVTGQDASSRTSANAVSGDIGLDRVSGEINAAAVSGDIRIAGGVIDRAVVESVSGDVHLSGALGDNARIRATSSSGDIDLSFAGNSSAQYSLSTFNGDIDNCFGPRAQESRGPASSELQFTEGDSGARVEVSTLSGDIELCR